MISSLGSSFSLQVALNRLLRKFLIEMSKFVYVVQKYTHINTIYIEVLKKKHAQEVNDF